MRRPLLAVIAAASLLPASVSAAIRVERPEIRATGPGQPTAAAYMVVRNTGKASDSLVSAECACAEAVMAHRTEVRGGVSRMVMETAVEIPPGGQVAFTPNGLHLMFTGVKRPIPLGSRTPVVLRFEKAGRLRVVFAAVARPGEVNEASASPGHHTR